MFSAKRIGVMGTAAVALVAGVIALTLASTVEDSPAERVTHLAEALQASAGQSPTAPAERELSLVGARTADGEATTTSTASVPQECVTTSGNEAFTAFRYAGSNRYETAVCVSFWTWFDHDDPDAPEELKAQAVVLARGDIFPDALAGGPLAASVQGPLLLTRPSSLSQEVLGEVQRVLAPGSRVYLLGGTSSVSNTIRDDLEDAGFQTTRLAGSNRYETAIEIAESLPDTSNFFFATGQNYPDALAAGTAASALTQASKSNPDLEPFALLLTHDDQMPSATSSYALARHDEFGEWTLLTAGGWATRAVSDAFGEDDITASFAGPNRYATATQIAEGIFAVDGQLAGDGVGLTTGTNFPDALSATATLASFAEPLLLTHPDQLSGPTAAFLEDHAGQGMFTDVFGGTSTVGSNVINESIDAFN